MFWWLHKWSGGEIAWFIILAACGILLLLTAWVMASQENSTRRAALGWITRRAGSDETAREARTGLVAGLGAGILTSLAVTFTLFAVQASIQRSQDDTTWKSNVATSWNIPGFEVAGHRINGINFSGKQLHDADFAGVHMRNLGVKFEDSNLEGAHFNGADLRGVDFLGAHFAGAEFDGANLKGADLRSADLSHTNISYAKDLQGALVNAQTCWPHGFLNNPNFNGYQLHRWEWIDPNSGKKVTSYGREWPACGERLS